MFANGSKPLQIAGLLNLRPGELSGNKTLIARPVTDPYVPYSRTLVVKSLSGERSSVVTLNELSHSKPIAPPVACPVLLQELSVGVNVRVHVCHRQVFAISLSTTELDYRMDDKLQGTLGVGSFQSKLKTGVLQPPSAKISTSLVLI